jgi:hypothetical protein
MAALEGMETEAAFPKALELVRMLGPITIYTGREFTPTRLRERP